MREITQLSKYAKSLGFEVTKTRNNHIRYKGYGKLVIGSGSSANRKHISLFKKYLLKISNGLSPAFPK